LHYFPHRLIPLPLSCYKYISPPSLCFPLVRLYSIHEFILVQARLAELPGSTTPAPIHQKPPQPQRPPMRRYKSELSWRPAAAHNGAAVQSIINAAAATAAAAPRVKRSESEYCFTTLASSLQVELGAGQIFQQV
jgi:hypothetical protein